VERGWLAGQANPTAQAVDQQKMGDLADARLDGHEPNEIAVELGERLPDV